MSLGLESTMHMSQSPILDTTGLEIFEAFSRETEEGKVDLDQDALDCIEQLLEDQFLIIATKGPNGSGKGGLLKGFRRIFQQSGRIRKSFAARRRRVELEIQSYPFALSDDCVQLPNTPAEFFIPPEFNPSTYTFDHTKRASSYQYRLIQERALPRLGNPRLATVVLIEASTPLAYPTSSNIPVDMEGTQDLGISTICNLVFDPRTRDYIRVYAVDRNDNRVKEIALANRTVLHTNQFDPQRSFYDLSDKMVIPSGDGKEIEVSKLPPELQDKIKDFILKTQAPPLAIVRLDKELADFRKSLYQEGLINADNNLALFEFYGRRLELWGSNQFNILENGYRGGRMTDDLGYFTESEPVRAHPQILSPLDLEEVYKEARRLHRAAA